MREPFDTLWKSARKGGWNIFVVLSGLASIIALGLAFIPQTPVLPQTVSLIWFVSALLLLVVTTTVGFDALLSLAARDPWQTTRVERVKPDETTGDQTGVSLLCGGATPPTPGSAVIIECCVDGFETQVGSGHVVRVQRDGRFIVRLSQVFAGRKAIVSQIASGKITVTDIRLTSLFAAENPPTMQILGTSDSSAPITGKDAATPSAVEARSGVTGLSKPSAREA